MDRSPASKNILDDYGKNPGGPPREMVVGQALPDPAKPMTISSDDAIQRSVARHLIDANMGDPGKFAEYNLIDPNTGKIKPFHEMEPSVFRDAAHAYFESLRGEVDKGLERYGRGYRDMLPIPAVHKEPEE